MKRRNLTHIVLVGTALLAPTAGLAEEPSTNHLNNLSLSARFGFNMSARFKGFSSLPPRFTPHGDSYNYDDGYVLTDISGNQNGQTWYWGYDSSASQISGNTILMNRSSVVGGFPEKTLREDPSYGAELVYRRQLHVADGVKTGIEVAANYQNLSVSGASSDVATVDRVTDAYPYTAGTTPPNATPSSPYQGSYTGPGFVIGGTPASSTSSTIPGGATLTSNQKLDADIWGFRLGPYMDIALSDRWSVSLSGGLAVGLLDPSVSWTQTASFSGGTTSSATGSGDDFKDLWGGYFAVNLAWEINDRWNVVGGVQYQLLQNYEHSFGGQNVQVDLRNAFYLTIGVGYSF